MLFSEGYALRIARHVAASPENGPELLAAANALNQAIETGDCSDELRATIAAAEGKDGGSAGYELLFCGDWWLDECRKRDNDLG